MRPSGSHKTIPPDSPYSDTIPIVPLPTAASSMRLTTRELHNLDDLLPNRRGLLLMTALITLAMAANGVVIVLMALQGELLNPYIDAALVVNIFTLTVMVITMFNRNLFYTPHLMSVVTAVCMIFTLMTFYIFSYDLIFAIELVNIVAMLGLWLAYATTVKSPPAQWLHPFQRPPATTSEKPSTADVNMQQVKKSNLPGSTV